MTMTDDLFAWKPPATYPQAPGYKEETTSKEAARKMGINASRMRADLLVLYQTAWPAGMTADEAAEKIGRSVFAVRPRVTELRKLGDLYPALGTSSGEPKVMRRKNASGMAATVLVCKKPEVR